MDHPGEKGKFMDQNPAGPRISVERCLEWKGRQRTLFQTIDAPKQMSASSVLAVVIS